MPAELMTQLDRLARARSSSRSEVIQRLLTQSLQATSDAEITARLNAHYAAPENLRAQANDGSFAAEVAVPLGDERW